MKSKEIDNNICIECLDFIRDNICNYNDFHKCFVEVNKLFLYLDENDIYPDESFMFFLFDNSTVLRNLFKNMILFKPDIVLKKEKNFFSFHKFFELFLDVYCMQYFEDIYDSIDTSLFNQAMNDYAYSENYLSSYVRQIDLPLLSLDEERILAMKMRAGDKEAKRILIERNLKLVVFIARRYYSRGLSFDDLIQEGNLGLMKALDTYDVSYGTRVASYAFRGISLAIIRAIDNYGRTVRIPVSMHARISKYFKVVSELESKLCHDPSAREIADFMGVTEGEIIELQSCLMDTVSINNSVNAEGDDMEFVASIPDIYTNVEDDVIFSFVRSELVQLLKECNLTDREMDILFARYGFYDGVVYTYSVIASKYNISKQAVQAAEKRALNKIRACERVDDFAIYLNNSSKCLKRIRKHRKTLTKMRFYYCDMESD